MESSSPSVPFPLLQSPIESNYRPCTFQYRFPSDNPRKATPTEIQWIDLFLNSVPSFRQLAENDPTVVDAPVKAEKFAQRYTEILEDMKKNPESHGGPPDCILLCRLREQILRELGFRDIFKKVKDEENAKAISLFEGVVRLIDDIEEDGKRVENLIRGILAGNIFDLGSAQLAEVFARDGMSFVASCRNLVARPWVIDDLDKYKVKWTKKSWEKAVIFVDNSGADVVLGILPFARELLRRGTKEVVGKERPCRQVAVQKNSDLLWVGSNLADFKSDLGFDLCNCGMRVGWNTDSSRWQQVQRWSGSTWRGLFVLAQTGPEEHLGFKREGLG